TRRPTSTSRSPFRRGLTSANLPNGWPPQAGPTSSGSSSPAASSPCTGRSNRQRQLLDRPNPPEPNSSVVGDASSSAVEFGKRSATELAEAKHSVPALTLGLQAVRGIN